MCGDVGVILIVISLIPRKLFIYLSSISHILPYFLRVKDPFPQVTLKPWTLALGIRGERDERKAVCPQVCLDANLLNRECATTP